MQAEQAGSGRVGESGEGGAPLPPDLSPPPPPARLPPGAVGGCPSQGCAGRPRNGVSYLTGRPWLWAGGRHKLHLPAAAAAAAGPGRAAASRRLTSPRPRHLSRQPAVPGAGAERGPLFLPTTTKKKIILR